MYAKGKGSTVPSDAQAREKWVENFSSIMLLLMPLSHIGMTFVYLREYLLLLFFLNDFSSNLDNNFSK